MRTPTGPLARNRANWVRDSLRNPTQNIVPGLPPGADPHVSGVPSESKVYPLAGDPSAAPTVRLSAPQGLSGAPINSSSATPGTPAQYSTQPGWLKTSGRNVEGRKTYVMISQQGTPYYYVTAQPGVNLDPYVKRHRVLRRGDLQRRFARQLHAHVAGGIAGRAVVHQPAAQARVSANNSRIGVPHGASTNGRHKRSCISRSGGTPRICTWWR